MSTTSTATSASMRTGQPEIRPSGSPGDGPSSSALNFENLKCTVLTTFDEVTCSQSEWDEASLRLGGSIYMSYDWLRVWWEFYGKGKELRLFIFRDGQRIVALLPLYLEILGVSPVKLRVARLVGANIPPKAFDPAVDEGASQAVFEHVINRLFLWDKCDLLSYGPVSGLRKCYTGLLRAADSSPEIVRSGHKISDDVHSIFWLPTSLEQYFEGLSKNERKNRRKYELRLLSKEFETKVEVLSAPSEVEKEFEEFVVQHARYWATQGKPGHFGAWPRALEYNRELVRAHARHNRVRFIRIVAGGKTVANQYVFAFGPSYIWELPARAVGQEWERFSLGPTGIVTMIGEAIKEGKKRLEGGLAHYDYKVRLGAEEYPVTRVRLIANRPWSRARALLFELLRTVFLVGYHKIWYRRIIPRLPSSFSRSQWNLWLRFDF